MRGGGRCAADHVVRHAQMRGCDQRPGGALLSRQHGVNRAADRRHCQWCCGADSWKSCRGGAPHTSHRDRRHTRHGREAYAERRCCRSGEVSPGCNSWHHPHCTRMVQHSGNTTMKQHPAFPGETRGRRLVSHGTLGAHGWGGLWPPQSRRSAWEAKTLPGIASLRGPKVGLLLLVQAVGRTAILPTALAY